MRKKGVCGSFFFSVLFALSMGRGGFCWWLMGNEQWGEDG